MPRKSKPKPKANPNSKSKPKPKPKPKPRATNMPGLTVDTSPRMTSQTSTSISRSQSQSRPGSPVRPPYSPITPTLESARLATATTSPPRPTYTHSQAPQTAIAQPPPAPITLDQNPDAIALRSAIAILQLQARNATADIQTLQRIKERAVADPETFAHALASGEVKTRSDPLFAPQREEDEEGDEEMQGAEDAKGWETIPRAQKVVRCPPINWSQYAVVGESLDKLHKDQQARPTEGTPQILQPDGSLTMGSDGLRRREDLGVAAQYQPGRDKIDRMGTRKGGKR